MIEIPAAALRAADLLAHLDFVSIGTNDLSQYTCAVDRMAGGLAQLLDPWQPAVLDLIAMVGAAGAAAGKSVGVCGEAASDPTLAPVLVGLGRDESVDVGARFARRAGGAGRGGYAAVPGRGGCGVCGTESAGGA